MTRNITYLNGFIKHHVTAQIPKVKEGVGVKRGHKGFLYLGRQRIIMTTQKPSIYKRDFQKWQWPEVAIVSQAT